ncbi:zinc finger protein 184 isoform X2 [Eleginops maclovinus]|uniref:zinc finger protein 184 isoform X2 n=1 Tax=Eleginops maclovinus TaxID=56733 RepID=UPI003080112C
MDEAAAEIREDGAENKIHDRDITSENNVDPSAEDTTDAKQDSISCEDCGLKFTQWDVYNTHLHQHALEEGEEEEEEEPQMGEDMSPVSELDSERGDDGESQDVDIGEADECDTRSSWQKQPSGFTEDVGDASTKEQIGKYHTCLVCGKVYTYLVSYQKHLQLHENPPSPTKSPHNIHNLPQHQCLDCGMSFIRRARLLGHMRIHRSSKSIPPRCDQCGIDFRSIKSWMSHVDIHRNKPFWCLSCAKGFRSEYSLDKHLRSHTLTKHTCHICHESFHASKQLRIHYNTHSGAKPYQCTFCGKSFFKRGNLLLHRKRHLRAYAGFNGMLRGSRKRKNQRMKHLLASVKEEPEMDTYMEHLPWKQEPIEENVTQQPCESGDHASSEESDCGEPLHHFKLSKPPGSALSDPHDGLKSEPVQPPTGQALFGSKSQENNIYTEHKYWEWECVECDMGFDEVEKLHSHYVKHATGELPIPHDDIEDI